MTFRRHSAPSRDTFGEKRRTNAENARQGLEGHRHPHKDSPRHADPVRRFLSADKPAPDDSLEEHLRKTRSLR